MPLTEDDVRLILTSPESLASMARQFGKSTQAISQVRLGITHQNLATDLPRRAPARSCHSCRSWRVAPDPCFEGIPDAVTEGPRFARDCEFYQPQP
jgi:hypothetical protein